MQIHLSRSIALLTTFALTVILSCGGGVNGPPEVDSDFYVKLMVSDTAQAAIPDLRVSCWNLLDPPTQSPGYSPVATGGAMEPAPTTTFLFALATACDYEITIRDLADSEITQILGTNTGGNHTIQWSVPSVRSGAYPYTLIAASVESGDTILNDTKYAYLDRSDRLYDTIGYTNSSGEFQTINRLLFPHLYSIPTQPLVNEMSDSIGTFSILNIVRFVLTDTTTGQSMTFDSVVIDGENSFSVSWDPDVELAAIEPGSIKNHVASSLGDDLATLSPGDSLAGDLNLNGVPFEQDDIDLYIDYFCNGLSVFSINIEEQIAASDANQDGTSLSVVDFMYMLLRDSAATDVVTAYSSRCEGIVSVESSVGIGAALLEFEGEITPVLMADNMQMCYGFDSTNTRVFLYSHSGESFTGDFLRVPEVANSGSIEMAAADGSAVHLIRVPNESQLGQNYPNPFN